MHIALISDVTRESASGVDMAARRLAAYLQSAGIRVTHVGGPRGSTATLDGHAGAWDVPTRIVPFRRGQVLLGFRPWARAVHGVLSEIQPDVIHAHNTLHNGTAASLWSGCPSVVTAHGNPLLDAKYAYNPIISAGLAPILRHVVSDVVRRSDAIINVTEDWRVNLTRKPERMHYIPNGIDDEFFTQEPPPPRPVVHFFGGSREVKGGDLLAQAWPSVVKRVDHAELRVYGDEPRLHALFAGSGAHMLAGQTSRGVAAAMAGGGTVVVPSRFEVSPLVVAEAWASMVPVVATAVGGVPAMAREAALLVARDARSLADALVSTLLSPAATDEYVRVGRERVEGMRLDAVLQAHLALYAELLERVT